MRIAHVTDFYLPRLGGIEMQVAELTGRQRAAGHEVVVITSSPSDKDGPASGDPYAATHTSAGVPFGPDRVARLTDDLRWSNAIHPAAWRRGSRAVRTGGFDLVHCHVGVGSPLGFFAARAAARAGIPTVVTVHSLWAWAIDLFRVCNLVWGWTRLPITWTAVSDTAARHVRRVLPDGAVVHVVPNGVDPARWARRAGYPDRDGEITVAAVMRLSARKRPLPLLRMLREAQDRLGDAATIRLQVAGCGPRQSAMERYLRRHDLADQVTLHGRLDRDHVRLMLESSDAFVAPANLESFGLAALEARCAGLPIVAKASGGLPEFIKHGREGLICETDGDMTVALERLARDRDLLQTLQQHNRTEDCAVIWPHTLSLLAAVYEEAGVPDVSLLPDVDLSTLAPGADRSARLRGRS
ncbi:glycosyltransferase family 4 protein [Arsenicicoccus sp. oral taxon 190]|uniref:glycosyltransferase family 4 protein n=1 Tax=Arsenicicoccus sp. oral taxon 190 TaxID=1658671 RepID=UPI00067B8563|nr:glycosyltransferase family 4 protein [Arsenicicoccus sp. oral taxon 190]